MVTKGMFDLIDRVIHTFSVLSLKLKKLRGHKESAMIDISNANEVNGSYHGDNLLLKTSRDLNRDKLLARSNHPGTLGTYPRQGMSLGTNYSFFCSLES